MSKTFAKNGTIQEEDLKPVLSSYFAGALMLSGLNKGIFVTTSSYQPAAITAAQKFATLTLPIELIDADRFYDALKLSQKQDFDLYELKKLINKRKIPKLFDYGWDTPRNSL